MLFSCYLYKDFTCCSVVTFIKILHVIQLFVTYMRTCCSIVTIDMRILHVVQLLPIWGFYMFNCYLYEDFTCSIVTYMRILHVQLLPIWGFYMLFNCYHRYEDFTCCSIVTIDMRILHVVQLLPIWGFYMFNCYLYEDFTCSIVTYMRILHVVCYLCREHQWYEWWTTSLVNTHSDKDSMWVL